MIASQLQELGFEIEVITKPHALGDQQSEFMQALREGNWDMALVGFNLSLGNDLSSYLNIGGANNFGGIRDPELVSLANAFTVSDSEESTREAAYEFQARFVERIPFLPLYFRLNSIICSADIKGMGVPREPLLLAGEKDWYISR